MPAHVPRPIPPPRHLTRVAAPPLRPDASPAPPPPPMPLPRRPNATLASPILLDPTAPTAWWPIPCSPHLYSLANFSALAVGSHLYGSHFDARSYPLGYPSPSAAAYRLDLALSPHRWERLPNMHTPRGSFACAPAPAGGIIVAGGGSRHPTLPSLLRQPHQQHGVVRRRHQYMAHRHADAPGEGRLCRIRGARGRRWRWEGG